METIAAVLVNYNGYESTRTAVRQLAALPDRPAWIIVVDNGSAADESLALAALEIAGLLALRSERNDGFAAGCNIGIRCALSLGCAAVFLINNDAVAQPGCLSQLWAALQSGAGAACPLVVDMDDQDVIWSAGGECPPGTGLTFNRKKGRQRSEAVEPAEVSFAPGCALLVRSEVFATVGLLPERWFLYFEDAEFSLNLAQLGLPIMYVPQAVVAHVGGASTRRGDLNYFFYWRNALLFAAEYASGWRRALRIFDLLTTMLLVLLFNGLCGRRRRARLVWRAAMAGLRYDWSTPEVLLR